MSEFEADAVWHRLSPRMLLIHPVVELGRALPALLGLFIAGKASGGSGIWGLVATAVVLVLALSRWFTTRLRITPDQVQLQRGLVRRQTLTTPIDRIRTVDVTSHLLHRALGLARVSIGTGTSDRRSSGRLVLDGLTAEAAVTLRNDLLSGRAGPTRTAAPVAVGEYIARLDPAWARYAPFTLSGAFTALVVFGFAVRLYQDAHVNVLKLGPLGALDRTLTRHSVVLAVAVVLGLVAIFVAVASLGGYLLAFWDFRLTRDTAGTLHVDRGLLTSRATSIEKRRLVGVELSEPLLLRAVGGARTVAIATGLRARRGAERGGEVLLPPAPIGVARGVSGIVLGTPAPLLAPLIRHSRPALRRRLTRALLGAVLLTGVLLTLRIIGGHGNWLVALIAVSIPLSIPIAVDRFHNLGHNLVDGYLVTRFGSIVRRHNALALHGVIGVNLRSTFFQRRVGLTTLTATTAAGKQRYPVTDLDEADAVALADAALPGLLTEFLA
jgi:putative membrane protein